MCLNRNKNSQKSKEKPLKQPFLTILTVNSIGGEGGIRTVAHMAKTLGFKPLFEIRVQFRVQ